MVGGQRMSIPAAWLVHTITVEPYLGTTSSGVQLYDTPVTVPCFVEEKIRHIRSANSQNATGDELDSTATVYAELTYAASCSPVSRVTLPDGGVTYVLEALRHDGGANPVPSHLELVLA
jgi:hypothetical protein